MRVALVFPPYKHKIFSENLAVVDEEFCLAPPLILAYVAAILEKNGHQVMLLDARILNLSKEQTLKRIELFKPDILGFRAEAYHFHDALDWVRYLKEELAIPVITGGPNLFLYPEATLSHKQIDYAIIGEAVEALPRLLRALENKDSLERIAGIAYRKDGKIIINPPEERFPDFNSYPFPARHLLPNDRYHSFISQRKNFTVMVTAIGCPFRCTFCAITHHYRPRSVKSIVDEIQTCYHDFNIREIDFFDPVFFIGKERVLEVFRELKRRRLDIEWSCRSRVDVVDRQILQEAARAGCRQIYYGIESTDPQILHNVRKEIALEQIERAVKWSNNYGIRAMGFFMIGNQGETKQSVRNTIEFAKGLGLDFVQVCRTIPKPGTELDKLMIEKTGRDYWKEHILGKRLIERLPTPWTSLSEKEREALTKEFYLKFYFRPRIIIKRLFQLKSLSELTRYIKVAWRMLLQKSELYSRVFTDTTEAEAALSLSNNYLSQAQKAKVALVIPTYNEKENIAGIISAVFNILPNADVVVVDDRSPDGTADIVRSLADRNQRLHFISREGEKGLGLAYIAGFKHVLQQLNVDYVFEMDADLSHNPKYLPVFLEYAKEYALVSGSRFLHRVSIKNRALWRNFISLTTKWLVNKLIGIGLTDVTTGFRCYQAKALAGLELDKIQSKGYAFQIEILSLVKQKGFAVKELPILFVERTKGSSKLSFGVILEGLCLVLRLAWRKLKR